jgi:hypothetical protein
MIGLIWNCQGLGKDVKIEFLRDLIREEKMISLVYKKPIKKPLRILG